MSNHPTYDIKKEYARGVWYASPSVFHPRKWAVYSPNGTLVSLHDSKKEAILETLMWAESTSETV